MLVLGGFVLTLIDARIHVRPNLLELALRFDVRDVVGITLSIPRNLFRAFPWQGKNGGMISDFMVNLDEQNLWIHSKKKNEFVHEYFLNLKTPLVMDELEIEYIEEKMDGSTCNGTVTPEEFKWLLSSDLDVYSLESTLYLTPKSSRVLLKSLLDSSHRWLFWPLRKKSILLWLLLNMDKKSLHHFYPQIREDLIHLNGQNLDINEFIDLVQLLEMSFQDEMSTFLEEFYIFHDDLASRKRFNLFDLFLYLNEETVEEDLSKIFSLLFTYRNKATNDLESIITHDESLLTRVLEIVTRSRYSLKYLNLLFNLLFTIKPLFSDIIMDIIHDSPETLLDNLTKMRFLIEFRDGQARITQIQKFIKNLSRNSFINVNIIKHARVEDLLEFLINLAMGDLDAFTIITQRFQEEIAKKLLKNEDDTQLLFKALKEGKIEVHHDAQLMKDHDRINKFIKIIIDKLEYTMKTSRYYALNFKSNKILKNRENLTFRDRFL